MCKVGSILLWTKVVKALFPDNLFRVVKTVAKLLITARELFYVIYCFPDKLFNYIVNQYSLKISNVLIRLRLWNACSHQHPSESINSTRPRLDMFGQEKTFSNTMMVKGNDSWHAFCFCFLKWPKREDGNGKNRQGFLWKKRAMLVRGKRIMEALEWKRN